MIVAFPYPVSCERSITFPTWNVAARLTLYCDPSAASTVRVAVPSNAGATHRLPELSGAEDAFTLWVHESPTCQVGVPIGPAAGCGRVSFGDPRFVRFSGPTATAKATSNNDVARTLTMSALRCVWITSSGVLRALQLYTNYDTDVEPHARRLILSFENGCPSGCGSGHGAPYAYVQPLDIRRDVLRM